MAIQCEICDSVNLLKQDGAFVCQDCGARYSIEEIRKMVSGKTESPAALTAPAPAPKEVSSPKPVAPTSVPQKDISQLMQWAEEAFNDGNTEACRKYMSEIKHEAPYDPRYLALCLKYGMSFGDTDLEKMVRNGPEEEKERRMELAYKLLEQQGIGIPFGNVSDAYRIVESVNRLVGTKIPQWRSEGFWDEKRMLEIHFKTVIRQMNEYKLPKDDSPDGLYARTTWDVVKGIPMMERYFEKMDKLIPDEYRLPLYSAFCTGARTILKGRFYTSDSKSWHNVRVNEETTIYGSDLKEAQKVLHKYEALAQQLKAQKDAVFAAEKRKRDQEIRAAKKAQLESYWAQRPEEYSQLKQCKAQIEDKIQKLKRQQDDSQKMAVKKAQADAARYQEELDNCGIFQGKRKKELEVLIKMSRDAEQKGLAALEENTKNYKKELKQLETALKEITNKINCV